MFGWIARRARQRRATAYLKAHPEDEPVVVAILVTVRLFGNVGARATAQATMGDQISDEHWGRLAHRWERAWDAIMGVRDSKLTHYGLGINLLLAVPPLIFLAFAAMFFVGLRREAPNELPSALVGHQAPEITRLVALRADPPPTEADLTAPGVKLVNFWASWCGPCRIEHPLLSSLADEGIPVIGVNYKDTPEKALGFLKELGDPYTRIGADTTGRTGLDWGIYGVPETFVVGPDGRVILRFPGPLSPDVIEKRIRPAMAAAG